MSVRRGGLGRGLDALFAPESGPPGLSVGPLAGPRYRELPLDRITANPKQPRTVFDADALAELVTSIREIGVLQPVIVREIEAGHYELVMGERRVRAAREAGLATVPAVIRDTADEALLRDALLENLHRQDLNPLEEAAAYEQLLHELGGTHEELAQRVGRSRSQVTNTIRLLQLPVPVQRRVAAGVLSAGHARALLAVADADRQEELASRIVAEGLSVRATEELVSVAAEPVSEPARRATRQRPDQPEGLAELADRLGDLLDTRVTVELGRRKGKLTVEFASMDDLERLVALMAPTAETAELSGAQT
jgi:ParB family chromosome partitioning protein